MAMMAGVSFCSETVRRSAFDVPTSVGIDCGIDMSQITVN